MRPRYLAAGLRAVAVAGVGIAVVGVTVGVPSPAVAATSSTLSKSAQDVTSPGANPVNHGDTINWVVNYADNGPAGPAAATITDPIAGAGTAQSYVPGSLRVPQGWTPSWSTDGTNYQNTDPGTATVSVRATNPGARQGGTNLANILLAPVAATATPTGGDGFSPIVHREQNGTVQAWNMYHHLFPTAPKLVCTDLTAGAPCAGGPWPKPVNTAPGPFGSGSTGDIASPTTPQYVQDPARPGVWYYAAITASSVGVGCLDLNAQANCGYVPLIGGGLGGGGAAGLAGLVTTAGNLYGVGSNGQVGCLVIASQAPCAGQPYAAIVPPNSNSPGANYIGAMTVAGGKVFASSSPQGSAPPELGCFDPGTNTACAGWASPKAIAPAGIFTFDAYTAYDTAGNEVGACSTTTSNPTFTACFTIAGAPMATPSVFNSAVAGQDVFNPETARTPNGHLESFFGTWGAGSTGDTVCYDWTAAAACAGFPLPATHPSANGGVTRDYGYSYDRTTQCLFGLGDAGILFSEDPTTSASPCIHSGADVSLTPSGFYCDGGTNHIHGYTNAKLENMNLANVNLAASTADVTDPGGAVIASPAFAPDGTLDLSGISPAAHPSITVSAHLVLNNSNDFTGGNQPHLVVSFNGDPPQVCFQTTVTPTCTVTGVTDTAHGSDATGTFDSNPVSLPVAPGPACQPVVTINKEICGSADPQNCGPGGPGPWVKKATPGLLGLLLANAQWRITVTNAGPVDITAATLNDGVERSCVTAAGTFDVAAGTSKQFFCSTFVLVSLLPLTNTASVTYTPVNSPAGTPPTTSARSSATACSLLCIL